MGSLPTARVTPARPFDTCGIDYAGPFFTKDRTRSKIKTKSYMCIFVCFSTKAVHLELAVDLSTDSFLKCLQRFIARRGRCHNIYTDNGTNFIGARNHLNELGQLLISENHNQRISNFLSEEKIQWHLIPPHAPHFGGLWESAVKSAKTHLRRVIGETILTYEELVTVFNQVEACLNSRPLSPLSDDPNDLSPLTPGHFLIGCPLTASPQIDATDLPTTRLNRYQHMLQIIQHFWKRWQREYLHQLQQRKRWCFSRTAPITPGMLVILRENNLPPLKWQMGRILEIFPGNDGITRVVSVQTADTVLKRPVTKICILPIEDNTTSSD